MQKSFNKYKNTIITLTVLSFFIPFILPVILLIYVLSKSESFEAAFTEIENINEYVTNKKIEADNNYNNIMKNANESYNQTLQNAENEKQKIESLIKAKQTKLDSLVSEKEVLENTIKYLEKNIEDLNSEIIIVTSNFTVDENITSEEYKDKISIVKTKFENLVKEDKAIIVTSSNSSRKVVRDNVKQLLRCFESESKNIISNVTVKNIDSQRQKLNKSYDILNKIFAVDGISLSIPILELKLEELNLSYAFQLKKEQEKEEQKAIREQMLEEEKVRREIEREKAKIEKEENQFKNEVSKLMKYLQKASDIEKQLYIDKINELEEKLKLLQKDKENVLEREQNTRAGFVYIISNIGSFGENIYKIGMTRRLEPMDRIKELGDASVPFEFDVHAMIFSEDAPSLETILHNTFKNQQVNKVNPRKEFYKVSLSEIEKVVKDNYNATVHFTEIAKAEQYRESLRLEKEAS